MVAEQLSPRLLSILNELQRGSAAGSDIDQCKIFLRSLRNGSSKYVGNFWDTAEEFQQAAQRAGSIFSNETAAHVWGQCDAVCNAVAISMARSSTNAAAPEAKPTSVRIVAPPRDLFCGSKLKKSRIREVLPSADDACDPERTKQVAAMEHLWEILQSVGQASGWAEELGDDVLEVDNSQTQDRPQAQQRFGDTMGNATARTRCQRGSADAVESVRALGDPHEIRKRIR